MDAWMDAFVYVFVHAFVHYESYGRLSLGITDLVTRPCDVRVSARHWCLRLCTKAGNEGKIVIVAC